MEKQQAAIIDLDGTLFNCSHRLHFIKPKPGQKKDWMAFLHGVGEDQVIEKCVGLIEGLNTLGWQILLVTGRGEEQRTISELRLNGVITSKKEKSDEEIRIILKEPYKLFMRPKADYRKDFVVKQEIYANKIEPFYDVQLVVDDKPNVINMYREMGLNCLHCDHWQK